MDRQNRPLCLNTVVKQISYYMDRVLCFKRCEMLMLHGLLTSFIQPPVHDAVLDLHVSGEVPLQSELARAVKAFEGFAV